MNKWYRLPDNYIYISHLDDLGDESFKYWILPASPDTISDSMGSTWTPSNSLGRSAPVYTYANSGPRTVSFQLQLHRDMMDDVNQQATGVRNDLRLLEGEDYVDSLVRALQSIALPAYNVDNKAVEPPLVAVRIGRQIFVKGVVSQAIGLTYTKPILANGKYAQVSLQLVVNEVDPYDATTVYKNGSYRGEVSTMRQGALSYLGVGKEA